MKIDLLLHHVSQDQRAPAGELEFFGWMHGPAAGGDDEDEKKKKKHKDKHHPDKPDEDKSGEKNSKQASNAYADLVLRPEPWGGVLINGASKRVYAMDAEAFIVLQRLKDGETFDDIRATETGGQMMADEMEDLLISLEIFR